MAQWEIVARPSIEPVRRLLGEAALPSSDIDDENLAHFFAARRHGELLGVVGLEPYGSHGLLRSLVVDASARGAGLGRALVSKAEAHACDLGLTTVYLLTETAPDYFQDLGYTACRRDGAPASIRRSPQFSTLCPATASFMSKPL